MKHLVSGFVVLIGKIVFLAALYGFLYVVFRGLVTDLRKGRRVRASAGAPPEGMVESWELRPPAREAAALHPPEPPAPAEPPEAPPQPEPAPPEPTAPPDAPVDEPSPPAEEAADPVPQETPPVLTPEPAGEPGQEAEEQPAPEPPLRAAALSVLASPEARLEQGARLRVGLRASIGRSPDNDIILEDRFVSSHHAEIIERDGGYVLRDASSTNGTFCNGVRVREDTLLRQGDRIGIGTSVFAFHEPE